MEGFGCICMVILVVIISSCVGGRLAYSDMETSCKRHGVWILGDTKIECKLTTGSSQ